VTCIISFSSKSAGRACKLADKQFFYKLLFNAVMHTQWCRSKKRIGAKVYQNGGM